MQSKDVLLQLMADPFTSIRIFVPDGDPEGVRLIDRMNWTGLSLVFPREKWPETRNRPEFARTGVYSHTSPISFRMPSTWARSSFRKALSSSSGW